MSHIDTDICVAGGGPAGLAAACAIVRATKYSVKVCLRLCNQINMLSDINGLVCISDILRGRLCFVLGQTQG